MHTLHFDPRQRLLIGFVAFALILVVALVAVAPLGQLDLAPDRGSDAGSALVTTSAPVSHAGSGRTPRWITDPLAPPLESLVRPAGG